MRLPELPRAGGVVAHDAVPESGGLDVSHDFGNISQLHEQYSKSNSHSLMVSHVRLPESSKVGSKRVLPVGAVPRDYGYAEDDEEGVNIVPLALPTSAESADLIPRCRSESGSTLPAGIHAQPLLEAGVGGVVDTPVDEIYNKIVHWDKHLFLVPTGSTGKEFVRLMAQEIQTFVISGSIDALYKLFVLPALLLQRTNRSSGGPRMSGHLAQSRWSIRW